MADSTCINCPPVNELINIHDRFKAHFMITDEPSSRDEIIRFCYLVKIYPSINYKLSGLTNIKDEEGLHYEFSGLLLLSEASLDQIPLIHFKQYSTDYTVSLKPYPFISSHFVLQDVKLLMKFLFVKMLNLSQWYEDTGKCGIYVVPLFKRQKNEASISIILQYLLSISKPINLEAPSTVDDEVMLSRYYSGSLIYNHSENPPAIRVDRIKWNHKKPVFIHFSDVSTHFSFNNHIYNEKQSKYISLYSESAHRKLNRKDYFKLKQIGHELREMKLNLCSNEAIEISCCGYNMTGIYTDLTQHLLLCPLIYYHIQFHSNVTTLEQKLNYQFIDRSLLELSLTHPSYHSQHNVISSSPITLTAASNCGLRAESSVITHKGPPNKKPKSGIEGLLDASQNKVFIDNNDINSLPHDNERLEFLGDAIVEFVCSIRLYYMFPNLSDGQLVIFRQALICNENLTKVAEKLHLEKYLLTHQFSEVTHARESFNHVLANTVEAIIGAIYCDTGLESCHKVLADILFTEEDLHHIWSREYVDPLQKENADGDRHMIENNEILKSFTGLEESIGVTFKNIRLLARAFTHPSFGYTDLMLGDYQRMEFLGDAVLQLLTSVHVYNSYPLHHEGHLSAFRTALVHNQQLAEVSNELGFPKYIIFGKDQKHVMADKIMADVVESFIAALYLDKGIEYAQTFCRVCLFPKLSESAEGLQFLDAKTRLQHAIVYTCKKQGLDITVPVYRNLSVGGPVNKQIFTVGVYFRGKRLATGTGSSTQKAGMDAAEKALKSDHISLPYSLKIKKT